MAEHQEEKQRRVLEKRRVVECQRGKESRCMLEEVGSWGARRVARVG